MLDKIYNVINEMSEIELMELHNNFCYVTNNPETVYLMEDLDEVLDGYTPTEIIEMTGNNFNLNHRWFQHIGYLWLESAEFIEDLVDIDEIVKYVDNHQDSLDFPEIQAVLDGEEDE